MEVSLGTGAGAESECFSRGVYSADDPSCRGLDVSFNSRDLSGEENVWAGFQGKVFLKQPRGIYVCVSVHASVS